MDKVLALDNLSIEILQQVTAQQAWHYGIIPYKIGEKSMAFLIDNQQDFEAIQLELELLFGKSVFLEPLAQEIIKKALGKYYRQQQSDQKSVASLEISKEQDLLEQLIEEAQQLDSSDIHLEPYEQHCRIRFRIDGVLIEKYRLEKAQYPSLVNKVKIKANLDIAEKRLPQDGRIFYQQHKQKFDIRVSSLPTLHGEKIVMRLLINKAENIDIKSLGFNKGELNHYLDGVKKPNGMVLISGPTGSGKTTTLYATLQVLNEARRNILTIEDPIEYTLEGINQVQLKEAIGLNFARAMRTFLRQDPDIIMVGEIRDLDTASMAIRASLTGHLVLSTIHTNSAWGIVARLIDMGVPGYLLADTLNAAVAQRLVRILCSDCKSIQALKSNHLPRNFHPPKPIRQHFIPKGCANCFYTGYKGRKAIYEVISIDRQLGEQIKLQELNVEHILQQKKVISLSDNAFQLLAEGLSSLEEVYPILATSGR